MHACHWSHREVACHDVYSHVLGDDMHAHFHGADIKWIRILGDVQRVVYQVYECLGARMASTSIKTTAAIELDLIPPMRWDNTLPLCAKACSGVPTTSLRFGWVKVKCFVGVVNVMLCNEIE